MATELKLNGIPKNGGFLLSNKGPIDVRTVVTEYSHLSDLISGNRGYVGMLVYVNSNDSNKGLYICESITSGGSWKPVATSSSTGDISLDGYATEEYVDNAIGNYYTKSEVDTTIEELENSISGKQDVIADLTTIRDGASLGATALQKVPDTYATKDDLKDFVVSTEGSLFDNDIKLSEDIWTDKSIGYINGSTSSPKKVANAGDTLKTMFTNIFGTITDDTTNLVTNPKISSISIGNSYYEFGTKLDSVSVSITTNNGKYKYGPSTTGSAWTGNYTLSGDGFTTKNNSTSNTQNINLSSTFIVGTSSELTLIVKRDYTAATTTALSKMGNNTTQKIEAGTAEGSETFNPTAKYYNYIAVTNSTSAPTTATASGVECNWEDYESSFTTTDNTYIWFLMPNKNKTKIQQFAMNQWNNVNTTYAGSIKFKLLSEAEVTYHAYRTDKMMSATGQYRIN